MLKAAKGLTRDFGELDHLQVSKKGPSNFVTHADLRSEKTLIYELKKARPAYGFLVEESGVIEGEDKNHRWIIDPLDGTTNFMHALAHFCISVALEKTLPNGKREITAGVVYDPIANELFWAEKGGGAYVNDRRLKVSARTQILDSLLVTGVPRHGRKAYALGLKMLHAVARASIGVRSFGAAALDLAYVAAGRVDGFWQTGLSPWDYAAGTLLVKEAGGMVCGIGEKEDYLESGNIIAANPHIHEKLCSVLRQPDIQSLAESNE